MSEGLTGETQVEQAMRQGEATEDETTHETTRTNLNQTMKAKQL
jgi:hypothetical protein